MFYSKRMLKVSDSADNSASTMYTLGPVGSNYGIWMSFLLTLCTSKNALMTLKPVIKIKPCVANSILKKSKNFMSRKYGLKILLFRMNFNFTIREVNAKIHFQY